MLTEKEARRIVERILHHSRADEASASAWWGRSATTRFANDAITQNVDTVDQGISVSVAFGKKVGSASINTFDEASLREVVRRAEAIAKISPPDPEHLPGLPAVKLPSLDPWHEPTASFGASDRARAAVAVIAEAKRRKLSAAGIVENGSSAGAFGSSAGFFGYQRGTSAAFSATLTGADSSGWVSANSRRISDFDPIELTKKTMLRAELAASPKEWVPGKYVTILEPCVVSPIVQLLTWGISAREIDAGRSFLVGKEGKEILPKGIVLRSDPFHSRLFGSRWFGEGFPQRKIDWIRDGKFQNVFYDRFTAKKHGVAATPWAGSLIFEVDSPSIQKRTLDQMIAETEKGILVTHVWYIRSVDPMKPMFTGMTRDALLAIEDGKITGGLKQMRWNENPVDVLSSIVAAGTPEAADSDEGGLALVPPLKVREFNFTSGTKF